MEIRVEYQECIGAVLLSVGLASDLVRSVERLNFNLPKITPFDVEPGWRFTLPAGQ